MGWGLRRGWDRTTGRAFRDAQFCWEPAPLREERRASARCLSITHTRPGRSRHRGNKPVSPGEGVGRPPQPSPEEGRPVPSALPESFGEGEGHREMARKVQERPPGGHPDRATGARDRAEAAWPGTCCRTGQSEAQGARGPSMKPATGVYVRRATSLCRGQPPPRPANDN